MGAKFLILFFMPDYFLIDVVCTKEDHEFHDDDLEPADYPVLTIGTDGGADSNEEAVEKYKSRLLDLEHPRYYVNSPLGLRVTPLNEEVWRAISLKIERKNALLQQIEDNKKELEELRKSLTVDMCDARKNAPTLSKASVAE